MAKILKNKFKKVLIGVLCFAVVFTGLGGSFSALAEAAVNATDALMYSLGDTYYYTSGNSYYTSGNSYYTQDNVSPVDIAIESITVKPISMLQDYGKTYDYADDCYKYIPTQFECNIEFTNGDKATVFLHKGNGYVYFYNPFQQYYFYYDLTFVSGQSKVNTWQGEGTHNASISLKYSLYTSYINNNYSVVYNKTITADVEVNLTSVELISVDYSRYDGNTVKVIAGTRQVEENGVLKYHINDVFYNIKLKNGDTINTLGGNNGISILNTYFPTSFNSDQSSSNVWTVGNTYSASISIGEIAVVPIKVEIIDITDFKIEPIVLYGKNRNYYPNNFDYNISLSNGKNIVGNAYCYDYGGYSSFELIKGDNYSAHLARSSEYYYYTSGNALRWGWVFDVDLVYGNKVIKTTPVPVEFIDYVSIEIIGSESINENSYSYIDQNGNKIYNVPDFSYKIHLDNGEVIYERYPSRAHHITHHIMCSTNQSDNPWKVGGENKVTVQLGNLTTSFSVKLEKGSDFEYIEQDGGIFITDCSSTESNIIIPDEIDGKPVLGVISLGRATDRIQNLTISDSVIFVSDNMLPWAENLTSIHIGAGVKHLDANMISNCYNLSRITVSEKNPYYCDIDGVVYNREKDTLVIYPLGMGDTYYVPASVINIDVLTRWFYLEINPIFSDSSSAYITLDGITYSLDMKKIISCSPEKTGDYTMPSSVEKIAESAFMYSNLKSVKISKNVTDIVYATFYGSSIESVTLPDGLKSIERLAFSGSSLESVALPESLEKIGEEAFLSTQLEEITIPSSVKTLGRSAFLGTPLKSVTLKEGIETIGDSCFSSTSSLEEIVIPNSVTRIESYAFYSSGITEAIIGSGLTKIEKCVFAFSELKEITVPENITEIENEAFYGCSQLRNVVFKNNLTKIGESAFGECPLKEINLGENVTEIGMYAFSGNDAESIKIPDSVTEITYGSFSYAENLINIDLPDDIKSVGGHAFDGTRWYNTQPDGPLYIENVFYGFKTSCPSNLTIKDGTTVIADYALENSLVESVNLPNTLKTIGDYAFYDSKSLTEIYIPASVNNIGIRAFSGCSKLMEITVDPNNPYYSSYDGALFNKDRTELIYCPSTYNRSYTIPDFVKFVRNYAFDYNNIQYVTIYNNDVLFDEYAFTNSVASWDDDRVMSFRCLEDSNAYAYAKSKLYEIVEIEPFASGYCGVGVQWALIREFADYNNDGIPDYYYGMGKLHILGTGEMENYKLPSLSPWYGYLIEEVTVSSGITYLGNNSFSSLNGVTANIKNPNIQFGWYAFDEDCDITLKASGGGTVEEYAKQNGFKFINTSKPPAPRFAKYSNSSIELVYDSNYEYSIDGINWQTSNVFTNIEKNTVLYFYQRTIGNHLISDATKCMIVSVPEVLVGNSSIHVNPVDGFEYALDDGIWQTSNIFEKYIVPEETYTVYQRPIIREGITILYDETGTTVTVNGDDKITDYNSSHLVWLKKILLLQTSPTNIAADINNDGRVNVLDLIRLKKLLAESK